MVVNNHYCFESAGLFLGTILVRGKSMGDSHDEEGDMGIIWNIGFGVETGEG
jgi:hypothetical protein